MSGSLNRVILIGNLASEPELKYTSGGTARTKFRLAVGRQYKDSSGQLQEETAFVPIVTWGSQAENCAQYLSKGRSAAVEGRIRIFSFTSDEGQEVRWFEVVASNVQFLGGPRSQDRESASTASTPSTASTVASPAPAPNETQSQGSDEEVPF